MEHEYGYLGVEFYKFSEGGPSIKEMRQYAKDIGIVIGRLHSVYVGMTAIYLRKGTKEKYKELLKAFSVDYL